MKVNYDKYYRTANLFGEPHSELMEFFTEYPVKGKLLDLGCGQGRNAITLARLGYQVTGIDHSQVGIEQMMEIAKNEKLNLFGQVGDIYTFDRIKEFDIVLMDSMLHFAKKDRKKEVELVKRIITEIKDSSLLVICMHNTGDKKQILNKALDFIKKHEQLIEKEFKYTFKDKESGYTSEIDYRMIIIEK